MPEKLSPVQVAKIISNFGQSKQISKALRIFYQYERSSESASALISAFVAQDVLSAWKLYRQFEPVASAVLVCLPEAHYKKHPHYLRDNLRFAGFSSGVDAPLSVLLQSSIMANKPRHCIELYNQLLSFETPNLCNNQAIRAYSLVGDVKNTSELYKTVKCHSSMARILPQVELVDFMSEIPTKERTEELYQILLERLDGDAKQVVEQEMKLTITE